MWILRGKRTKTKIYVSVLINQIICLLHVYLGYSAVICFLNTFAKVEMSFKDRAVCLQTTLTLSCHDSWSAKAAQPYHNTLYVYGDLKHMHIYLAAK